MTTIRSTEETAVREVMAQLYAAWADNDADAFASHYVDEATVIMPGVLHQDSAAVRQSMAMGFNGPLRHLVFHQPDRDLEGCLVRELPRSLSVTRRVVASIGGATRRRTGAV